MSSENLVRELVEAVYESCRFCMLSRKSNAYSPRFCVDNVWWLHEDRNGDRATCGLSPKAVEVLKKAGEIL